ncbi:hypothetical protein DICPUDRAFT_92934 [Dictyostelium purpureum]|uniref:SHSP domain-containing protein n=1 Tax=Dictyostelium purpureum TaxID=5786 RepID=F0ZZH4_DICPU|nr:uncharacterized protein DICPUDRAFT_92934 [Dictyostelium purpureum]EGC30666.1 hypothetical protein DICPUDRAFT_92934 [Dictyostelium purpureum]|eukprot:XP_003292815.1 hypothetical protein DICPUDRAFT_92934 [Dictyostelium purpureum]
MATIFDILLNQHLNNNNNKNNFKSQTTQTKKEIINFIPESDAIETSDSLIIETELAGVNKDDIQIEINDSKLYIQGEKKRSTYKNNTIVTTTTTATSTQTDNEPSIEEFENDISTSDTTATSLQSSNKEIKPESSTNNTVTSDTKEQVKKYISERSCGKFKKCFDLNRIIYTLDLSSIKTQYNNGLLTITINKKKDYSNTIKINLS